MTILCNELTLEQINAALLRIQRSIQTSNNNFQNNVEKAVANVTTIGSTTIEKYDDKYLRALIEALQNSFKKLSTDVSKNAKDILNLQAVLASVSFEYDPDSKTIHFTLGDYSAEYTFSDTTYTFSFDENTQTLTIHNDLEVKPNPDYDPDDPDSPAYIPDDTNDFVQQIKGTTYSFTFNNGKLVIHDNLNGGTDVTLDFDARYYTKADIDALITALSTRISSIETKIPAEATADNKLADKAWVTSQISISAATFRGTYNSVADLNAYSGPKDANDYAFVKTSTGYDRYTWVESGASGSWQYEFSLEVLAGTISVQVDCTDHEVYLAGTTTCTGCDQIVTLCGAPNVHFNPNTGTLTSNRSVASTFGRNNNTDQGAYTSGVMYTCTLSAVAITPLYVRLSFDKDRNISGGHIHITDWIFEADLNLDQAGSDHIAYCCGSYGIVRFSVPQYQCNPHNFLWLHFDGSWWAPTLSADIPFTVTQYRASDLPSDYQSEIDLGGGWFDFSLDSNIKTNIIYNCGCLWPITMAAPDMYGCQKSSPDYYHHNGLYYKPDTMRIYAGGAVFDPVAQTGYDEGIRINRGNNGWTSLTIGGDRGSFNGCTNAWWIGNYCDESYRLYISHQKSTATEGFFFGDTNEGTQWYGGARFSCYVRKNMTNWDGFLDLALWDGNTQYYGCTGLYAACSNTIKYNPYLGILDTNNIYICGYSQGEQIIDLTSWDADTLYPIVTELLPKCGDNRWQNLKVSNFLDTGCTACWMTHASGFTASISVWAEASNWGTAAGAYYTNLYDIQFTNGQQIFGLEPVCTTGEFVFYLRGGACWRLSNTGGKVWRCYQNGYTTGNGDVYSTKAIGAAPTALCRGISYLDVAHAQGASLADNACWLRSVTNPDWCLCFYYPISIADHFGLVAQSESGINKMGIYVDCSNSTRLLSYTGVQTGVVSADQTYESFWSSESSWASYLIFNHGDGSNYYHQMLRMPFFEGQVPQYHRLVAGGSCPWHNFITDENFGGCILTYRMKRAANSSNGTIFMYFYGNNDANSKYRIWLNGPGRTDYSIVEFTVKRAAMTNMVYLDADFVAQSCMVYPIAVSHMTAACGDGIFLWLAHCAGCEITADIYQYVCNGNKSTLCVNMIGDHDISGFQQDNIVYINTSNYCNSGKVVSALSANMVSALCLATYSKLSMKKDIAPYKGCALCLLKDTDVVSYRYKTENESEVPHIGFIADYTNELLSGKNKDTMRVNDNIGLLIKSVQELDARTTPLWRKLTNKVKEILKWIKRLVK